MQNSTSRTSLDLDLLSQLLQIHSEEQPLLCYGIGDEQSPLADLQNNLLELLTESALASTTPSRKALLVGDNLQAVAAKLTQHELAVTLLGTGRHALIASDGAIAFHEASLLEFSAHDEFDLLIYEGTYTYLDQLPILQKARQLLRKGGRLLLLGEFLARDNRFEYSPLANLESLRRLSLRLGFQHLQERDFSAGARVTLEALRSWLDALPSAAFEQAGEFRYEGITEAISGIRAEFADGRRCLQLIELQLNHNPDDEWSDAEFSTIDSFSTQDVAQLFAESFQTDFDPEVWDWKYHLGKGQCVIARTSIDGRIVAHYGGAPRKIDYFGDSALAIQVCDVMVLPEVRRSYGKSSLFFRTAATFLEREIGYSVKHLLGFGFPNQKAMNIATRLGLYEKTDEFVEVLLSEPALDDPGLLRIEDLRFSERAAEIDALWQLMRCDFTDAIIGVRDSAYFEYRFLQHPFGKRGQYRCLQVLGAEQELRAVAVLKQHGEHYLLMDVFAQRDEIPMVLSSINAWSLAGRENGEAGKAIKFWITRSGLARLDLPVAAVHDLGIEIPCNSWNAGPPADQLLNKWWLTAGDMDFL